MLKNTLIMIIGCAIISLCLLFGGRVYDFIIVNLTYETVKVISAKILYFSGFAISLCLFLFTGFVFMRDLIFEQLVECNIIQLKNGFFGETNTMFKMKMKTRVNFILSVIFGIIIFVYLIKFF